MRLSFIQPRKKHVLKGDTKFWMAFVAVSLELLGGFSLFLYVQVQTTIGETKQIIVDRAKTIKSTEAVMHEHETLKEIIARCVDIASGNEILKDNIKNLFDIVPDQVTLKKVEISASCLSLFGVTPSREIFNYHFAPALRSIFTTSQTSFVSKGGGWSEFVSINKFEIPQAQEPQPQSEHKEAKKEETKHDAHAPAEAQKGGKH
jgi:hypothetical protein